MDLLRSPHVKTLSGVIDYLEKIRDVLDSRIDAAPTCRSASLQLDITLPLHEDDEAHAIKNGGPLLNMTPAHVIDGFMGQKANAGTVTFRGARAGRGGARK
jgi:hypothetical protein